jgi:hypothetical protein
MPSDVVDNLYGERASLYLVGLEDEVLSYQVPQK